MATGVRVGQLPQDDVISGDEKVLISDNGTSKYATVNQLKSLMGNDEQITYILNKLNSIEETSDPWTEYTV